MPLGVLDDTHLEHTPGTSPLSELGTIGVEDPTGVDSQFLKHDPTGRIVLVPQPSDSPNDPYNWPKWRKMMYTAAIAYGCGCVGGQNICCLVLFETDGLTLLSCQRLDRFSQRHWPP